MTPSLQASSSRENCWKTTARGLSACKMLHRSRHSQKENDRLIRSNSLLVDKATDTSQAKVQCFLTVIAIRRSPYHPYMMKKEIFSKSQDRFRQGCTGFIAVLTLCLHEKWPSSAFHLARRDQLEFGASS